MDPPDSSGDAEPEDLLSRNLMAFARSVSPDFARKLAGVASDLRYDRAADNIFVGEAALYPEPATEFAAAQVAAYMQDPQRLSLRPAAPAPGFERINDAAADRLYAAYGDRLRGGSRAPEALNGFLICFGVGAAKQIPRLAHGLAVRWLILVDQSLAFLRLSLETIDWASVIAALEARGGGVRVVTDGDPVRASHLLYQKVRALDAGLLDGSYLYGHLSTSFYAKLTAAFAEALPVIGDSDGFFEDEALMIRNAAANLGEGAAILVDRSGPDGRQGAPPALIIGSGPSIDGDLETIRALSGEALVISGGTGLGVLLEAGIKPDLHCEIENVPDIVTANQAAASRYDLSGMHLVASATVDPRLTALYDTVSFLFRDSVSSTRLFGSDETTVTMAGPTVTHLACRVALALGCAELYLFGVDLGSTTPEAHHSKHSIYGLSDDPYWRAGAYMEALSIPTEGNFRDQVYTSREFAFARLYFTGLARAFRGRRFFNCSNGVRIEGVEPLRGAAVSAPPSDARPIQDILAESQMVWRTGDKRDSQSRLQAALAETLDAIAQALDESAAASDGYIALYDRLWADLSDREGAAPEAVARFVVAGTLGMILQTGNSIWGRLLSTDQAAFVSDLRRELADAVLAMRALEPEFGAAEHAD